ncbi:MAG: secretory subunit [Trizodia sp. TS-e1964]|nr:MAG: secretory subunit [Trizodia sp. TS-e1964]
MSTDYNYDEQGQFFPFFILTVTGLVTLPLSYNLLKSNKDPENTAPRIQSDFRPAHADLIDGQRKKQKRRERKTKRIITVVVGWIVMVWMVYLIIVTTRLTPQIWDPYDILKISRSASEKAIKAHYRKLSVKHHPDKVRPDPALNQTVESLNDYFVELTKAYKALTDEEIRNNYVQYGHPDGKQSFSIGIALPKFIVTDGNGKYVLLVYGLLLGVLLPYVVGKWWYGTQAKTRERVLIASAGKIFREYDENTTIAGVLNALSSGEEFREILPGEKADSGLGKLEGKIFGVGESPVAVSGLTLKDQKFLESQESTRRKALGLMWAYLGRVDLEDPVLNDEKYEVAPTGLALNNAYLAIALAYGHTKPILAAFYTSQHLIQGMSPGSSPLLQLPYITPAIAKAIEGSNTKNQLSVQEFMQIPDDKRRKLSCGPGLLTVDQYKSAISVAKQLPALSVEKAFFKVMGERFITPSSLVQLVIKARVIPPGSTNVPEVNPTDLEDVDPDEDDLEAILGRKPAKNLKAKSVDGQPASPVSEKPVQPALAHAPYFARDHSPRWHAFLADSKQGKMAVPPFTFTTFDKPLFDSKGNPTYAIQTFKSQFQAPPQAGRYTFAMHLVNDSYVGLDTKMEITLAVEEMARAEEITAEDEISEPDEDSIAGQMNALKTGGISGSAPKRRIRKPAKAVSSDDESGTDEDVEEGSETDTDTDGE